MADNIYIYHTSPNQKSIITHKTVSDDSHIYGKCNVEATLCAAKELSDRAFKLYIRLNLHQDGHTYALSPVAIQADIGMSDKRYREAVKELTEKGYLVQNEKHKSLYVFYEFPQRDDKRYQQKTKAPVNPAETAVSSTQNGRITRQNWIDNPAISGGEIEHNITSHTTSNITIDSSNIDGSPSGKNSAFIMDRVIEESRKSYIAPIDEILAERIMKLEQEKKNREAAAWEMSTHDDDDAVMFAEAEEHDTYTLDDDELPF